MNKIVISGGCGFIGSALVDKLNHQGIAPVVIDIKQPSQRMRSLKFDYVKSDIVKIHGATARLLNGSHTTLVHLAADTFIPYCEKFPQQCFNTNVYGTFRLVNLIKRGRGTKIIFASSASVYPPLSNKLDEKTDLQPVDTYGNSKKLSERIIRSHIPGRYKIFRLFNVYGYGDVTPHLIPSIIRQLHRGSIIKLGNLGTERDYIFIDDVVGIITKELTHERKGSIYNVGTGVASSTEQVIAIIEKLLGRRLTVLTVPALQRNIDRPRLVSNPARAKRDYGISHFTSLKHGLSSLIKKEKI